MANPIGTDPAFRKLRFALALTRAGLVAERLLRCFWPLISILLLSVSLLMLGLHDMARVEVVWGVAVVAILAALAALVYGVMRFRWPSRAETLTRLDETMPGRPIQALLDDQAIGQSDPASAAVWRAHQMRMAARASTARAPQPNLRIARRDPYALRYMAVLAFAVALGAAAITTGDAERAVTWLERAHEGGDELSTAMLLMAYRGAERTDDYLRLAARMGLPVPGDLATDETPLDTLLEGFGVARGEHVPVTLHTSLGDAHCELFPEVAPITVNSFLGLATGTIPWITPDGDLGQGPLYRDLPFHRVIPEFMVQTGDPEGTGKGGPGYRFPDEVDNQLRFDEPGRLAMANGGPDSNGSQFFITEKPARHLDGRHTIFGQCDEASVSLVERIARADEVVTLESVEVPGMPVPAPTPFPPPPEDDKL